MFDDLVVQVVSAVALGLAGVLVYFVRQAAVAGVDYLRVKIGVDQLNALKETAGMVVRAIEQSPVYREFDGAQKKEQAIGMIQHFASQHGIEVSFEEVDHLIEEAVQLMNSELGPVFQLEEAQPALG